MDIASLVIATLALLAAGWAAWATHRQAQAAQSALQQSQRANDTAERALAVQQEGAVIERSRLQDERRPQLTLEVVGPPARNQTLRLRNHGPVACESVCIMLDAISSEQLATGLGNTHRPNESSEEYELPVELLVGAQADFLLHRTSLDTFGSVDLYVHSFSDGLNWNRTMSVELPAPPRS